MARLQEARSEETKQAILQAAGRLFSAKGFDAVSIREIAKAAGCSHTTLYIYFKDKEALLHELSVGPLEELYRQLAAIQSAEALTPEQKVKQVSSSFIHFCLTHRNMYTLFFMTKSERVDSQEPSSALNRLRNQMFALLQRVLLGCLPDVGEETALAYARIYFYALHGIVGTYSQSEESAEALLERLRPTFELAIEVLLAGFHKQEERE